jgi:hypothetical protein
MNPDDQNLRAQAVGGPLRIGPPREMIPGGHIRRTEAGNRRPPRPARAGTRMRTGWSSPARRASQAPAKIAEQASSAHKIQKSVIAIRDWLGAGFGD